MSEVMPVEVGRLFIHTLGDLEQRATATDEYTVLMSAGLLRKLLLDHERLVDQVNRIHRLNVRFRISDVSPYEQLIYQENPMFWAIEDALDPESILAYAPCDATRDQFLNRRVMRSDGRWITVRDVIDHLANVEGAVHRGTAKDERQKAVHTAQRFFRRGGLPAAVSQVRLIARITTRGLQPLRDSVVASGAATWASVSPTGTVELRDGHLPRRTDSSDD